MNKYITVSHSGGDTAFEIQLQYTIETVGAVQTITCSVEGKQLPIWLQLRKFKMMSLNENNSYIPLHNESNNDKNLDTSLFIDKAYTDIMRAEKYKVRN